MAVSKTKKEEEIEKQETQANNSSALENKQNQLNQEDTMENQPETNIETTQKEPTVFLDTEEEKSPRFNKKILKTAIIILLIIGLVAGGIIISRKSTKTEETNQQVSQPTAIIEETSLEENTELIEEVSQEVDLSEYSVEILNGSGVPGEAGKVKETLETQGFEGFTLGNADNYDYADTEVSLKEGTPKLVFETIEKALSNEYQVIQGEVLKEASQFDVVVTVGIKINDTTAE